MYRFANECVLEEIEYIYVLLGVPQPRTKPEQTPKKVRVILRVKKLDLQLILMAKITSFEGKLPKRIEDYVIYPLDDAIIIKAKSGFTTKALKTSPKYALSRQNASEFGRVSATCKQLRTVLASFLPKKNNLAVVNALTKNMRHLLVFDTQSARGERVLHKALASAEAQAQLKGYDFNPDASSSIHFTVEGSTLTLFTDGIVVPNGAKSIGVTVVSLVFDFETGAALLCEGGKHFFWINSMEKELRFEVEPLETSVGVWFTILVVDYYQNGDGDSFIPMNTDVDKMVLVVDVGLFLE